MCLQELLIGNTNSFSLCAVCLELCGELAACPGRNAALIPRQAPLGM